MRGETGRRNFAESRGGEGEAEGEAEGEEPGPRGN